MTKKTIPMVFHRPELKAEMVTEKDLSEVTEVWHTYFTEPFVRQMFPYTPSLIQ